MTWTDAAPEKKDWYWCKSKRDGFEGPKMCVVPNTDGFAAYQYGPRIPGPEELEALEKCAEALRLRRFHNDTCAGELIEGESCSCGHADGVSALAALDAARSK